MVGELGHFAIVGDSGDVVGSASIYPDLLLRKLRLPIPAGFARGKLAVEYPYATPNIHAWIRDDEPDLRDAYDGLSRLSRQSQYHRRIRDNPWYNGSAWTVEPQRSPQEIHTAISSTSLEKVATRRFDEGESRHRIPPRGTLYAEIQGIWFSAHGKQQELQTGEMS